jgi:hypothetical protein
MNPPLSETVEEIVESMEAMLEQEDDLSGSDWSGEVLAWALRLRDALEAQKDAS